MSGTATPEGLPRRALVWAVVTVVGVLAAVALDRLAGSVDDDVGRRAADDARAKLAVAVAASRTDVEAAPSLRGEDLVAAVSGRVADVYRGVVTEVTATQDWARVDAYVDGDASHLGGVLGTELTRRLCVRITVEPGADRQVDVSDIACSGAAARLPPDTRETHLTDSASR